MAERPNDLEDAVADGEKAARKRGRVRIFKREAMLGIKMERHIKDELEFLAAQQERSVSFLVRKAIMDTYNLKA